LLFYNNLSHLRLYRDAQKYTRHFYFTSKKNSARITQAPIMHTTINLGLHTVAKPNQTPIRQGFHFSLPANSTNPRKYPAASAELSSGAHEANSFG